MENFVTKAVSCGFAALSGIFLVSGVAVLAGGRDF